MNNSPTKPIKIIATYARVSTSNQEDQKTIDAQLLEVHKFAAEKGYTIVSEYADEGWSGDILARPDLDRLRNDAKKKIWDAVLVYDPDRIGRRYFYQELIMDELKQKGIETLFVTVPPVKDLNDRMMGGMRGLFAEYEKAKITERFRIGKVNRVTNGHVLASEAPYGYTYVPNAGKKGTAEYIVGHYTTNERETSIVRLIFKWVADDGLTIRTVVRKLQERGIAPRKSKRGVWNTSTLSTLLRNETYIGRAHWGVSYAVVPERPLKALKGGYKKIEKTSRRIRPVTEWYDIKVPAIIDHAQFAKAQAQLTTNFARSQRNKKNEYLLGGIIRCICGRTRAGEGPMKGKHLYYRCADRVLAHPLPRTCMEGGINARITDKLVWDKLTETIGSSSILTEHKNRRDKERKSPKGSNAEMGTIKKELEKLKNEENRYHRAYGAGVFTVGQLKDYVTPIREKMSALGLQLAQVNMETEQIASMFPSDEEIGWFTGNVGENLEDLGFEKKRAIVADVIEKVVATQKQVTVHGTIPMTFNYAKYKTIRSNGMGASRHEPITSNHVEYKTERRNRRAAKRR